MLRVIDQLSWPGSPNQANEDACGVAGAWAWVIDASIFPGTTPILHDTSDAAWFASFACARFAALATTRADGPALVRQVVEDAAAAFMAVAPEARRDALTWPMAALTLVRAGEGRLDAWTLADTVGYVLDGSDTCRSLGDAPAMRRRESAEAAALLSTTGATLHELRTTEAFRDWLLGTRRRAAERGEAPVLTLTTACVAHLRHEVLELEGAATLLLASDGFSALVELYGAMDARTAMELARSKGLAALAGELRRIEVEQDPEARAFPRFKRSDDATALLLDVR